MQTASNIDDTTAVGLLQNRQQLMYQQKVSEMVYTHRHFHPVLRQSNHSNTTE